MSKKTYADILNPSKTPQTELLFGRDMKLNNAGGHVFEVTDWDRLTRFLILGSDSPTYYVQERPLTVDNAKAVLRCIEADGLRVVREVVDVSTKGSAPKQDPALFVLALAAAKGSTEVRAEAYKSVNAVCRTGTALFKFVANSNSLRGWGKGLRKAISNWYTEKTPDQLAYQVTKYQQRDGWSHRDVLRLSHTKTFDADINAVLRWCCVGVDQLGEREVTRKGQKPITYPAISELPTLIEAVEAAKKADNKIQIVKYITDYGLVREHIPTKWLNEPEVWEALLEKMPLTAMIRNLGNLTKCGVVKPLSNGALKVLSTLSNQTTLKKARVHPLSILIALKTYASGHGFKGSSSWTPVQSVVDSLDEAFYSAFDYVKPTGKRWLVGMDVSGSMSCSLSGTPLSCVEATAALALVLARTEPNVFIGAFTGQFTPISFGKRTRLDDAMSQTRGLNFGRTDCAQPILYANANKMDVDAFLTLTDNETWAGSIHPSQALKDYRSTRGLESKNIVVGMVSTGFSIADPLDSHSLDVVGFDTAVPDVIANFVGRDTSESGDEDED